MEKHGLGIATFFLEQQNNSVPIRIINARERPKELQKNEQVGLLMPADLLEEEVARTTHDHAIEKEQPELRKIFGEQGEHLSAQEKEDSCN